MLPLGKVNLSLVGVAAGETSRPLALSDNQKATVMTRPLSLFLQFCLVAPLLAVSLDVPFIRQTKEGCGSAAMAMVVEYWRDQLPNAAIEAPDVQSIQNRLHSAEAKGIYGADMEAWFREAGFHAFRIHATKTDLLQHLERGRPLIVCVQPGRGAPLHYVVVVGYDAASDVFLLNDPARGKFMREPSAKLMKVWKSANNWAMIAVPEGSR